MWFKYYEYNLFIVVYRESGIHTHTHITLTTAEGKIGGVEEWNFILPFRNDQLCA